MKQRLDIKKITALAASAAIMSSMTGCGRNTTWGAEIDGAQIPAGVFIYYLQNAYYDAQTKVNEEAAAEQTGETAAPDLLSAQIDGISAKSWIYNEATKNMQEYAAVESKFAEYGLSLTDEEKRTAESYCTQMWDYGGEYYTSLGISESSYKSIFINNQKRSKLFETLYSEGGEHGVSDEELKTYLEENYALVNYIKMELRDGEGNLLKSEGKAERKAMAEEYIERYKNGEDFDKLRKEYEDYYEELKAQAAEASGEDTSAEGIGLEETDLADVIASDAEAPLAGEGDTLPEEEEGVITSDETEDPAVADSEEEAAEETESNTDEAAEETAAAAVETEAPAETEAAAETEAEETETEPETDTDEYITSSKNVIGKSESTPCQEVVDAVFGDMNKGDIRIVETQNEEYYYVVLEMDIMENDGEYFELSRSSLLFEMKDEDYEALIETWAAAQNVNKNQAAYDRYDPLKLFADL